MATGINLSSGDDIYVQILANQPFIISGNAGNDLMIGILGNDFFLGNGGNDTLLGLAGNDTLYGGMGNDVIDGGAGRDILMGDAGSDTVTGGFGADFFRFNLNPVILAKGGVDDIVDFRTLGSGNDIIQLENVQDSSKVSFVDTTAGAALVYDGVEIADFRGASVSTLQDHYVLI